MKKIATAAAIALIAAAPAFAGNVEPFVAPIEVVEPEQPIGSNAAWLIPIVAIIAIGAAVAASD